MDSINRMAVELVDEAIDFAEELRIVPQELDSGARVLDFGVNAEGGVEAGLLLAEIQTAGLATIQTRMGEVAGVQTPHVEVQTDHPAVALLCSQKAGWELEFDDPAFEGLGAGPARALVAEEDEFHTLEYFDEFDLAVLSVESISLPSETVIEHVANKTGVNPGGVMLPTYATGSVVGSVTAAARAAERALFRLFELGYDVRNVHSAFGSAPIAPISHNESVAMGRTNDALAYGGTVHLTVTADDPVLEELPSTARDKYGTPFEEIFAEADWDFYDVPESVFAPAQVTVDVIDGPTHVLGETNEDLVAESFGY